MIDHGWQSLAKYSSAGWFIYFFLAEYHGASGPVKVVDAAETPELTDTILAAAQEIGDKITDVNGKNQIGRGIKCRN